jgi:hypothetical protein
MTEAEWHETTELHRLLFRGVVPMIYRGGNGVRRKLTLWTLASSARIAMHLPPDTLQEAQSLLEQRADGVLSQDVFAEAATTFRERALAAHLPETLLGESLSVLSDCLAVDEIEAAEMGALGTSRVRAAALNSFDEDAAFDAEMAEQDRPLTQLLFDIFGNPFRPVVFDPEWRTSTAVALAQQMYESRDFSPMPILADALQDAGCDNADILNHCREPNGVHVRGCWVVDLVLVKE